MVSKFFSRSQPLLSLVLFLAFTLPVQPDSGLYLIKHPVEINPTTITSLQSGLLAPGYSGCGGDIAPEINFDYEQQVVELVNHQRQIIDLPPLKRVPQLDDSARYHATDLGQDNYFDHDTHDRSGDRLVYVCETWSRISIYYTGARGENIAAGYSSPEAVINGWMNSSGHRANILSASNWEIGVGYYQGSGYYGRYWVQNFGRRSGVYPLIINNESSQTDAQDVSLYIYGDWEQVRLRNNDGEWSAWQPFINRIAWQLPNQIGQHTVYTEMRSGDNIATGHDSIYLSTSTAVAQLGNLPDRLNFYYDQSQQRISPEKFLLMPSNIGSDELLEWHIIQGGDWFSISQYSGISGEIATISPTITISTTDVTYTGMITVTVTSHPELPGSPHPISLHLYSISEQLKQVYLPFVNSP